MIAREILSWRNDQHSVEPRPDFGAYLRGRGAAPGPRFERHSPSIKMFRDSILLASHGKPHVAMTLAYDVRRTVTRGISVPNARRAPRACPTSIRSTPGYG
jgi:hypothetical protein